MLSRKKYMAGECTSDQYYRDVYQDAGITITDLQALERVHRALKAQDEYLTTIPMRIWETLAMVVQRPLREAFTKHGEPYTTASAICALKVAAIDAVHTLTLQGVEL